MPVIQYDSTNNKIRDTYTRVLQMSKDDFVMRDGLGDPVMNLIVSGSTTISGSLTLVGSIQYSISDATSPYSASINDGIVMADFSGPVEIQLPPASGSNGTVTTYKLIGTGWMTLKPVVGELIDDHDSLIITARWTAVTLLAYNSNWYII